MSFQDLIVKRSAIFDNVVLFRPSVNYDERGSIFTSYIKELYLPYLPEDVEFIHDKFAESKYNVLRGLHGDNKTWKLVSCIKGEIFQVVVDNRPNSRTYLKWDSWMLNEKNRLQILIPPDFVNGYYVMSHNAIFHYKLAYQGRYFDVKDQTVIKWNDKRLKIAWPCTEPILQPRDK